MGQYERRVKPKAQTCLGVRSLYWEVAPADEVVMEPFFPDAEVVVETGVRWYCGLLSDKCRFTEPTILLLLLLQPLELEQLRVSFESSSYSSSASYSKGPLLAVLPAWPQ